MLYKVLAITSPHTKQKPLITFNLDSQSILLSKQIRVSPNIQIGKGDTYTVYEGTITENNVSRKVAIKISKPGKIQLKRPFF